MLKRLFILTVFLSMTLAGCLSSDDAVRPTATPMSTATPTAMVAVSPAPSATASPTATAVAGSALDGTEWRLVELVGEPVDPAFGVTLTFEDGSVLGYSGCNSFGGSFTASESGSIAIEVTSETDAGCPSPLFEMDFQVRYFDALSKTVRYFLDPPRLALHAADDATLLLFEPLVDAAQATPTAPPISAEPTPTTPIADHGNVEIYVMNADGSNQYRPAPSLGGEHWPAWMPDGRLTFQSDRTGANRLYAVHPDSSGLEALPVDLAFITSPVKWSADGNQIYYASGIDSLEQLYVADANGSNPRRITKIADGTSFPDWSPDGSRAIFTNRSHGPAVIYSINIDGSGLQRLTFDQEATEDWPVWSPDGSQIAYAHYPNEGQGGIFIMNADGSGMRQLTMSEFGDGSPSWSPDGRRIAFGRGQDIWVVNVDGSDLRQLTDSPHADEIPVWSPDGTQIAFVSNRDGGQPIDCSFYSFIDYRGIPTLDELVWISEAVLTGTVVEQFPSVFGSIQDADAAPETYPIYTDFRIDVDIWIRGDESDEIRLRTHGGTVGACTQVFDSEPQVSAGDRLLLFLLEDDFNSELPAGWFTLGGPQGFWPVNADGALEPDGYLGHAGGPLDELVEELRELLRQPEPDYSKLVPLSDSPLVEAD